MGQAVSAREQQQYFANQLNMMKHQSRLSKTAREQQREQQHIQKQISSQRNLGKLDYNFSKSGQNQQQAGAKQTASKAQTNQLTATEHRANLKKAQVTANQQIKNKPTITARVTSPFRKTTSSALRSYWRFLIPSYGLTLIGINLHGFFSLITGHSFFCKYGHEWVEILKSRSRRNPTAYRTAVAMGDKLGILEKMLLLIIDFIVLSVIFLALVLLVAITMTLFEPWWAIWDFLNSLYDIFFV